MAAPKYSLTGANAVTPWHGGDEVGGDVVVEVTGIGTSVLTPEQTGDDGATVTAVRAQKVADGAFAATIIANGLYRIPASGGIRTRVKLTTANDTVGARIWAAQQSPTIA